MKHLSAIFTALIITAIIGLGVGVIGVSAIANPNTVPTQNSRTSGTTSNGVVTASDPQSGVSGSNSAQVQQLQQEVNSLQSQLGQASGMVQQYQSILQALVQRGVIQVDQNGNIFITRENSSSDH